MKKGIEKQKRKRKKKEKKRKEGERGEEEKNTKRFCSQNKRSSQFHL